MNEHDIENVAKRHGIQGPDGIQGEEGIDGVPGYDPDEPEYKTTVELINYTGMGMKDPADFAARHLIYTKNTRLTQGSETRALVANMSSEKVAQELFEIANTIRSSWEFIDYTFEIKQVTRAFTHQHVRTRTGTYAQQAQRVVDLSGGFNWHLPKSVKNAGLAGMWETFRMMAASMYKESKQAGVPAQDCRGILPTNAYTNIISKFNLRTIADLCAKRANLRAQGEYGNVMILIKEEVLRVHPWADQFIDPDRLKTPQLDKLLREVLGDNSPVDRPDINAALKELDALKGVW